MNSDPARPVRLAVVLSHPTQYYSPWFRWLRQNTSLELRVFYLWDFGVTRQRDPKFGAAIKWDVDLLSGYDSEFVPNRSGRPGAENFFGFNNPGLAARLAAWHPDAMLIFGYKWASHLRAVGWAIRSGVPVLFRGDSHLIGRGKPSLPVRTALRLLFSRFAAFLYVGAANREYFEAFGVAKDRLYFAPHSVDAALFDRSRPGVREDAERLRKELRLGAATRVVLFAGKLVPEKQPFELLQAFVAAKPRDAALIFVGDGPEGVRLREFAAKSAAGRPVHFLPFANQTEMPSRYLIADLFALPSRGFYETWGLAVNEAMLMGVQCLVSSRVGCQRDLVTDGQTGWVFDPADPGALEATLARALAKLEDRSGAEAVRGAVARRIAGYTYAKTAEGLQAALAALHDKKAGNPASAP